MNAVIKVYIFFYCVCVKTLQNYIFIPTFANISGRSERLDEVFMRKPNILHCKYTRTVWLWLWLLWLYPNEGVAQAWLNPSFPKREVRAVWLGTIGGIDWPRTKAYSTATRERQKQELCTLLDELRETGINVVVLQTRIRGTVIYPSRYEPWDDCMTGLRGRSPGYDPLQFAVEECHKRGMELHAWLVCIPLGSAKKQKAYGRESITFRRGELCQKAGSEWFMRPDKVGTADYMASLCEEIVDKYDVDGISLDYIRYPEVQYHYRDMCTPSQRRENISRIVQRIHDRVKQKAPWVKLSSSPIGKYRDLRRYSSRGWNCYDAVAQDPQLWLAKGWQDWLFPMMYFRGDQFYPFLFDWKEHAAGHPVAAGLGVYLLDPREGSFTLNEVRAQMYAARQSGVGGVIFYRAEHLVRDHKGIRNAVRDEFFPYPALTPALEKSSDMGADGVWDDGEEATEHQEPEPPSAVYVEGCLLAWDDFVNPDGRRDYTLYNIYGADTWPVNTDLVENLLLTGVRGRSVQLTGRAMGRRYYAVTSMDRYGRESTACQEPERKPHGMGRP